MSLFADSTFFVLYELAMKQNKIQLTERAQSAYQSLDPNREEEKKSKHKIEIKSLEVDNGYYLIGKSDTETK